MKFKMLAGLALAAVFSVAASAAPVAYVNAPFSTPQELANSVITNVNTTLAPTGSGTVGAALNIPAVASAVNQFNLSAGATTVVPVLSTGGPGADTNIGLALNGNGTGSVYLGGSTAANAAAAVAHGTTNVNQIVLTGTNTGTVPSIVVGGSGADANLGLAVNGIGTGSVYLGGSTAANAAASVAHGTANVNQIVLTGTNTGTAPTIAVGGSGADANRNLGLAGAGTGIVTLGQTICTVSGASAQTCNGQRGIVTTNALSTAGATNAAYTINNSSVTTSSLVVCTNQGYSGTLVTNGYPVIMSCVPGTGTITVNITNTHAANALSGTVQIGFAVLN